MNITISERHIAEIQWDTVQCFVIDPITLRISRPIREDIRLTEFLHDGKFDSVKTMFSFHDKICFIQGVYLYQIGPHNLPSYKNNRDFMLRWDSVLTVETTSGQPLDYLHIWRLLSL